MKLKMYSIYDVKTEAYAHPHFLLNKGTFTRALLEALQDPQSQLSKYPADFTAFEIGEWDDQTGLTSMYPSKINLGCLLEFVPHAQAPRPVPSEVYSESTNG